MLSIASRLGIAEFVIKFQLGLKRLLGWHVRFVEVAFGPQGKACFEAIKKACRDEGVPVFFSELENYSGPHIHGGQRMPSAFYPCFARRSSSWG